MAAAAGNALSSSAITFALAEAKCILVTAVCASVCLSVCLFLAAFPHYCTDPNVIWGNGRGCHLVVHYWAALQSVHGFRCYYDSITPNAKCQRVPVLALFLLRLVDGTRRLESARLILFDRNWHCLRLLYQSCDDSRYRYRFLFKCWFLFDRLFYVVETTMTSCASVFSSHFFVTRKISHMALPWSKPRTTIRLGIPLRYPGRRQVPGWSQTC